MTAIEINQKHKLIPNRIAQTRFEERLNSIILPDLILGQLEVALTPEAWGKHKSLYSTVYSSISLETYCVTHAIYEVVNHFRSERISLRLIYSVLSDFLDKKKTLQIHVGSYSYFVAKVKQTQMASIQQVLISKALLSNQNCRKFPKYYRRAATIYYRQSNLTYEEIHKKINTLLARHGKKTISISTLKHFYRNPTFRIFNRRKYASK